MSEIDRIQKVSPTHTPFENRRFAFGVKGPDLNVAAVTNHEGEVVSTVFQLPPAAELILSKDPSTAQTAPNYEPLQEQPKRPTLETQYTVNHAAIVSRKGRDRWETAAYVIHTAITEFPVPVAIAGSVIGAVSFLQTGFGQEFLRFANDVRTLGPSEATRQIEVRKAIQHQEACEKGEGVKMKVDPKLEIPANARKEQNFTSLVLKRLNPGEEILVQEPNPLMRMAQNSVAICIQKDQGMIKAFISNALIQ